MTFDETLGYDDRLPDAYDKWISEQDANAIVEILKKDLDLGEKVEAYLWEYFCELDASKDCSDELYDAHRDAQND